jgi:hypothetical protein
MGREFHLDDLWNDVAEAQDVFEPQNFLHLPEAPRRYLQHAISPGTPLASAVRLQMHGEIKLGRWLPFEAEQVIRRDKGMIWCATVRMSGLPIHGWDILIDGQGEMRWKLLGIIPVLSASGPDVTRSAIGRVEAESIWLPSQFCHTNIAWTESGASCAHAEFTTDHEPARLDLFLDAAGGLEKLSMPRWGNPEGGEFHYSNFGGIVEEEGTFGGSTIPTRLRVGWYFGEDRFEKDGEFFRVTIDTAVYK